MSNSVEAISAKVRTLLEKVPMIDEPIKKAADKLHVDKAYIALGIAAIPIIIIFLMGAGVFLVDVIGFVYPAYASIKAVETEGKADDSMWLTYWIIFCLFKVADGLLGSLLDIIPFFLLIKLGFLVWCYHPSTTGSRVVYDLFVKTYIIPALGINRSDKASSKTDKSE